MFILYSLVIGLVVGWLAGGRISGLGAIQFRWPWVMLGALMVQLALFSDQVTSWIGDLGAPIYVASTVAVALAVVANRAIPGMLLITIGAASNLAAIVANGGYMPSSPGAQAALGKVAATVYSNSVVLPDPALSPLTDIFAMPPWLPMANVFSLGDVLIGLGVVVVIVSAMRHASTSEAGVAVAVV